jgi:hypothetical protein
MLRHVHVPARGGDGVLPKVLKERLATGARNEQSPDEHDDALAPCAEPTNRAEDEGRDNGGAHERRPDAEHERTAKGRRDRQIVVARDGCIRPLHDRDNQQRQCADARCETEAEPIRFGREDVLQMCGGGKVTHVGKRAEASAERTEGRERGEYETRAMGDVIVSIVADKVVAQYVDEDVRANGSDKRCANDNADPRKLPPHERGHLRLAKHVEVKNASNFGGASRAWP